MQKRYILLMVGFIISLFTATIWADNTVITGAGATFPYPIYTKWAEAYQKQTGVKLNFQPIGSGGGIKQIQAKTVDFGASDKPLSVKELAQGELAQFPTVIGGVVPIINIGDMQSGQIKLSGAVLADIYAGKVKKWNDAKITALNPDQTLPDQAITVVHRSDGSGTTFLFTHYLSKVNSDWKAKVGSDTAVSWPVGIGGKGNEGVASYVQRVKGSIGYVEFAYAQQNRFMVARLINQAGNAVYPSLETFKAAAANAHWDKKNNFAEILTDQPGANSWPIAGATFILMHKTQDDPQKAQASLKYFDWAYQNGQSMAEQLDYVPLPDTLIKMIHDYWREQIKDKAGKSVWA